MRLLRRRLWLNALLAILSFSSTLFLARNAGVLPWAVNPIDGRSVVLLGLDHHRANPNVIGGGYWTDFGGGVKAGEHRNTAAAREFVEETMQVFYKTRDIRPYA